MSDSELGVWCGEASVGRLWRDGQDRLGFHYADTWQQQGFRLSAQLPLQAQPFVPEEGRAHFFFRNLLPEAGARERLVRARRLTDSDFVLLREFGADCAGALSILPAGDVPVSTVGQQVLDERALHELVLRRGPAYFSGDASVLPRLSLAGAQDKCPVIYDQGNYALPVGVAASTHILKFQVPDFRHVPRYEYLLAQLASAVGLAVPTARLARVRDTEYLCVTRFDRVLDADGVTRLHQEDLYQALGTQYRDKYESLGGPGFASCMQAVRQLSEVPAADILHLLRWQIFNWLSGNSDGHAKNLALVQVVAGEDRWRLAPFYDLVCTRALDHVDSRMAMAIGGEFEPRLVAAHHWAQLANDCGLAERLVLEEVGRLTQQLRYAVPEAITAFEAAYGRAPELERVRTVIEKQCQRSERW
jgi:serine/threonine-protein kinase HipA